MKVVNKSDENELLEITQKYEQGIYKATYQNEIESKKQSLGINALQQQLDQIEKENTLQNVKEQLMTPVILALEPKMKQLAIFEAEIEQKIDKNKVKQITDEFTRSLEALSKNQADKTTDINHVVQIKKLSCRTLDVFCRVSLGNERARTDAVNYCVQ